MEKSEREHHKAHLIRETIVAWVGRTIPTGRQLDEMVRDAVALFDYHLPPEKESVTIPNKGA